MKNFKIKSLRVKFVMVAICSGLLGYWIASLQDVQNDTIKLKNIIDPKPMLSKHGKIIGSRLLDVGGITEWMMQTPTGNIVLYTTHDGNGLISGAIWSLSSGVKVSRLASASSGLEISQAPENNSNTTNIAEKLTVNNDVHVSAMDGKYTGQIPESMKTVDGLAGIKEGNGSIADTVYIIVDPRCPYCQQAYVKSRKYIKMGYSIKWIPASALGDAETGNALGATLLQNGVGMLDKLLGQHEDIKTKPTKKTEEALNNNLAFLFAAFEQNGGKQAGVPAAFFLDHRTGKSRMMTGVSEMVVLQDIFGN